jgi:hypothetical protein
VALPAHLRHGGSTAYHKPYRCRCGECLAWRRLYDRRIYARREAGKKPRHMSGRSPWYVCVDRFSTTYSWHDYDRMDLCQSCGADREVEEFWEAKWKEQQS